MYVSRACIAESGQFLRGLNRGQKKEIYFWNKAKIFSSFPAYTDPCTSSCKIVVASKRPLIELENGVMTTPKCRSLLSFIFTCICISKPLLIR